MSVLPVNLNDCSQDSVFNLQDPNGKVIADYSKTHIYLGEFTGAHLLDFRCCRRLNVNRLYKPAAVPQLTRQTK